MYKCFSGYRFPYNLKLIKNLPRAIKYRWQRMMRGWADCDTWDADLYFLEVWKPMLQYFREHCCSYPADMEDESWSDILDRMIFLLGEMEKIYDHPKTNYKEHYEHCESCKNEFFELFSKYFYNLWD